MADEIFFPQTQVTSIGGATVGACLFYNFPLDLVINIFIFKLPDMVTQFSSVLLFYVGKLCFMVCKSCFE